MLKSTLVLVCLFALGSSVPFAENVQPKKEVYVVRDERVYNPDGSYSFVYETSDGQKREETGKLVQLAVDEEPVLVVKGSYSYLRDDGLIQKVEYTADENGYRATEGVFIDRPSEIFQPDIPPPVALPPNAINSLVG